MSVMLTPPSGDEWNVNCFEMIDKKEFCTRCPFHDLELIHTELEDGTLNDYCPKCQELFGEKI